MLFLDAFSLDRSPWGRSAHVRHISANSVILVVRHSMVFGLRSNEHMVGSMLVKVKVELMDLT